MLKGPIAQATIRTSLVLGLRLVVQAGTLLLVARMLGPNQFGSFAAIASLAVLLGTFSSFGMHLVLLGEVSKNKTKRQEILSYAVPTTLISSSLLFFIYLTIYSFWFSEIKLSFVVIVCVGITEIVLLPLFVLPVMELLANGKTVISQLLTISPLVLRMLVAGCVVLLESTHALIIFALLYMITALIVIICMKFYKQDAWLTVRQWRLATRAELKHSLGYATLALTAAGPSELDKMLAVKILPLNVSGLYTVASRIVGAATLPVIALLLSALPKLFQYANSQTMNNHRLMKWILISVFLYGLVLSGVLWLAAPLFEWLFSQKYTGMAEILKWICLAVPGLALRIAIGSMLMTLERPWMRAAFEVFGMLVLSVTAFLFYPHLGGKGMALALVCSEWAMVVIGLLLIVFYMQE